VKVGEHADYTGPMRGHVEVDETQIGGRQKAQARRKRGSNKTVVMGIVERDGRLRAGPIPNTSRSTLEAHVLNNVERGASVSTDEWFGYSNLANHGYAHGTVDHSSKEYVRGDHHTNTLEGHWSKLKRSIHGTHVHVSSKHLWTYVEEFSYRRNFRRSHRLMFDHLVASFSQPRVAET